MTILYGISNCDTVRKARRWLDSAHIDYRFHDFRQDGIDSDTLSAWCAQFGWETLLNKRSTSWRALTDDERSDLDATKAVQLMLAQPTLIKRPVLARGVHLLVGFKEADYRSLFA